MRLFDMDSKEDYLLDGRYKVRGIRGRRMEINWYQVIMNGIIIGLLLLILVKVR